MAFDFYSATDALCDALAREGLDAEVEQLRAALAVTGTVTEILMRIRWHLRRMYRDQKSPNPATRQKMHDLLRELDAALS